MPAAPRCTTLRSGRPAFTRRVAVSGPWAKRALQLVPPHERAVGLSRVREPLGPCVRLPGGVHHEERGRVSGPSSGGRAYSPGQMGMGQNQPQRSGELLWKRWYNTAVHPLLGQPLRFR